VRSGALGSVYAFAVAGFGGTTQFMIKWLSGITHSAVTPALYMAIPMVVAVLAMASMPETAPVRTGRMDDI
jgi:hypothetical protein